MAVREVDIRIKLIDEMSKQMQTLRANVDSETARIANAGKRTAAETDKASQILGQRMRSIGLSVLSVAAAYKVFTVVSKALKDAGLQTEEMNKSLGKISATFGSELLPEAQAWVDMLSRNGDVLAKFAAGTAKAVLLPFRAYTAAYLEMASKAMDVLGLLPTKFGREMKRWSAAFHDEAAETMKQALDFGSIEVKMPKVSGKPVGSAIAKTVTRGEAGTIGAEKAPDYWKTMQEQITAQQKQARTVLEFQREAADAQIALIADGNERAMAQEQERYRRQKTDIQQNNDFQVLSEDQKNAALQAMALQHSSIIMGINRTVADHQREIDEKAERMAAENAERQRMGAAQTAVAWGNAFIDVAKAAKVGGTKLKRLSEMQALIDTYAAANASYKAMAGIPVIGPFLGAAAAAAAVVSGLANVAMIEQQKFALGGRARPGMALVGEFGPELVQFDEAGTVYNSRETQRMLQQQVSNDNSQTVTVHFHGNDGGVETMRAKLRAGAMDGFVSDLRIRMASA